MTPLSLTLLVFLLATVTATEKCKFDLVVLLDSSGSVGDSNFEHERTFTNQLIVEMSKEGSMASTYSNIALAAFGGQTGKSNTHVFFRMTPLSNMAADIVEDAEKALRDVVFRPGTSNAYESLLKARELLAGGENESKAVVMIMDGAASDLNASEDLLVRAGVKVIELYVHLDTTDVHQEPPAAGVLRIRVPRFSQLSETIPTIKSVICNQEEFDHQLQASQKQPRQILGMEALGHCPNKGKIGNLGGELSNCIPNMRNSDPEPWVEEMCEPDTRCCENSREAFTCVKLSDYAEETAWESDESEDATKFDEPTPEQLAAERIAAMQRKLEEMELALLQKEEKLLETMNRLEDTAKAINGLQDENDKLREQDEDDDVVTESSIVEEDESPEILPGVTESSFSVTAAPKESESAVVADVVPSVEVVEPVVEDIVTPAAEKVASPEASAESEEVVASPEASAESEEVVAVTDKPREDVPQSPRSRNEMWAQIIKQAQERMQREREAARKKEKELARLASAAQNTEAPLVPEVENSAQSDSDSKEVVSPKVIRPSGPKTAAPNTLKRRSNADSMEFCMGVVRSSRDVGYKADPEQCQCYYNCYMTTIQAVEMPTGTHSCCKWPMIWEQGKLTCSTPEFAGSCDLKGKAVCADPQIIAQGGRFPHPKNCRKFYQCVHSETHEQCCPTDTSYDVNSGRCNLNYSCADICDILPRAIVTQAPIARDETENPALCEIVPTKDGGCRSPECQNLKPRGPNYNLFTGGRWIEQLCPRGTSFSRSTCSCSVLIQASTTTRQTTALVQLSESEKKAVQDKVLREMLAEQRNKRPGIQKEKCRLYLPFDDKRYCKDHASSMSWIGGCDRLRIDRRTKKMGRSSGFFYMRQLVVPALAGVEMGYGMTMCFWLLCKDRCIGSVFTNGNRYMEASLAIELLSESEFDLKVRTGSDAFYATIDLSAQHVNMAKEWTNICIVKSAKTLTVRVNFAEVLSTTLSGPVVAVGAPVKLGGGEAGADPMNNRDAFKGYIDEFVLCSQRYTNEELNASYKAEE